MGPIGMQEMIVIFLIILLLFGAKKIPELARGIGKGMGEFKKAKEDFEHEIKAGEVEGQNDWDQSTRSPDPAPAPAASTKPTNSGDASSEDSPSKD